MTVSEEDPETKEVAIEVTVTEEPNLVKEVTQLHLATEAIKVMDDKCGGIGKKMIAEPMISVRQWPEVPKVAIKVALVSVIQIVQGQKFVNFMPKELVILVPNVKIGILMLLEKLKGQLTIGRFNEVENVYEAYHLLVQEEVQDRINNKSKIVPHHTSKIGYLWSKFICSWFPKICLLRRYHLIFPYLQQPL